MKKLSLAVAALSMMAVAAVAADKVESGLKPGESLSAFQVVNITGQFAPKQNCLV